jgi:ribosome maturation factor RimP
LRSRVIFVYHNRFLRGVGRSQVGWRPLFILDKGKMSKLTTTERIEEIAERVATENNLELVHAEVLGAQKSPTVRIFIDKEGGVTHEDCSLVSREVGAILDAEDFISSAYLLEVSSPGLERKLYSLKDFERFAGNLAKVKTYKPINGQRNFSGRIKTVEAEEIIFDDKTSGEVRFPFDAVAKANLEIDIEEEFRRSEKRKTENGE